MVTAPAAPIRGACLLNLDDVERVIVIDRAHTGRSRRHFFEKRFAAAKARPDDFIHVGVHRGGALRGFATARILRGEFGRDSAVAVLDAFGVEPASQEQGVGQALVEEMVRILGRMGVRLLQSEADWTNRDLLRFFDASGFALAPRLAMERSVVALLDEAIEEV